MAAIHNGEEMLEAWDWNLALPTGEAVPRKKAHREGIPHEGVHLWVIRISEGRPEILFQHRASLKDTYPDCLDITVGGHVPFQKEENKIQKEAFEEIGISPPEEELMDLGYYRYEEINEVMFHREFQRVYLCRDDRPLDGYRFNDGEVDGIYGVPLEDLARLLNGDHVFSIEGFDGKRMLRREVSRRDFHPLLFSPSMEIYMEVVLGAVKELVENGSVSARMPSPI